MPSLMLMDWDFKLLAEIPQFVGLTLSRAYWETGSFKLTLKRGMPGWDILRRDALLYFPKETHKMLVIEKKTVTDDQVTVEGTPLKGIIRRRLAVPAMGGGAGDPYRGFGWDSVTADAESVYLHYAANNLTAPEDSKRKIPRLALAPNQRRGQSLPWRARFDKLTDLFADVGQATNVGWDIRPDFANKRYLFGAWAGADRTVGAGRAVISTQIGNADSFTVTDDAGAEISTIYAGGAGEDESRLILSVGSDRSGLARREEWTEVSGTEDTDMLRMGAERKRETAKLTMSVTVRDSGLCRYERDYNIGDLVTLVADGWQQNARLIAMEEVYEGGQRKLKATFGDAPVTLARILRGRARGLAR